MNVAQRMSRLWTELAFEVLALARALESQGKSIIHLEIGEPDFDTPAHIKGAAKGPPTRAPRTTGPPPACPSCARPSLCRRAGV